MKDTLDREREEKLNVRKLEDYFKEVLPALRSNLFVSLIEGRISEQEYQRFLSAYRVEMQGRAVLLCDLPYIQHSCARWCRSCTFVNVS